MNNFDYKSNSHKSKELKNSEEPKKKFEKITSGEVSTKKKSGASKLVNTFISEDVHSVKSYVVTDVVIPAFKKLAYDIITDAAAMFFYGEDGRNKRSGSNVAKVSYSNFYDQRDANRFSRDDPRSINNFDYEDLVFRSRGDAEAVRVLMIEAIERYGHVTVADMYDACGRTGPYTANKYGWTNLSSATVVHTRDGYKIKLPRAFPID
jgi:hypothetical protein